MASFVFLLPVTQDYFSTLKLVFLLLCPTLQETGMEIASILVSGMNFTVYHLTHHYLVGWHSVNTFHNMFWIYTSSGVAANDGDESDLHRTDLHRTFLHWTFLHGTFFPGQISTGPNYTGHFYIDTNFHWTFLHTDIFLLD